MSIRTVAPVAVAAFSLFPALVIAATYNFEQNPPGSGGYVGTANGCTAGDNCSSNANVGFGGSLGFNGSFGTLSATAQYQSSSIWQTATVVQDDNGSNPKWVGLGVYHTITGASPNASFVANDDNITSMEALVLTFSNTVTLTNVKLRAEGHGNAFAAGTSFKYGIGPVDSSPTYTMSFASGTNVGSAKQYDIVDMTGTQFVFYGLPNLPDGTKQEYYVSEITVVPEPEAYGLALAGMGVVALGVRRRRRS